MFILLTGPRHVGKTTACWKALPGLRATGLKIAGFVSPPLLNGEGRKTGIEMVDLTTGQRQKFARVAGQDEIPTVGVYRVAEEATDWARGVLAAALTANADWLVIDEIGPLELHHNSGFAFALGPLAERIGRTDTVFVEVTEANRLEIPSQLVRLVQAARAKTG
jgi:nucleoside-triphosphatase THEP1